MVRRKAGLAQELMALRRARWVLPVLQEACGACYDSALGEHYIYHPDSQSANNKVPSNAAFLGRLNKGDSFGLRHLRRLRSTSMSLRVPALQTFFWDP